MKIFMFIFLLVPIFTSTYAQNNSIEDTIQNLDKLFSKWNTSTPGAVVIISRNGKFLYQKAFGLSDIEHNVINTFETVFEAGSVSKQFTAAAVLLLIQEGKIALHDDIRKYFPDFPNYSYKITIENLLHHTSGLRDWGSVAALSGMPKGTRVYTPSHVKEIIWRQNNLNFVPSTAYSYSNTNYNLLVFLVEKISGQSFQMFTREKLFIPAGMNNTRWRDNYKSIVPNRAIAYSKNKNSYQQNMPFENTFGHGGLLTTAGDLEKWNRRWSLFTLSNEINKLQKSKVKLINGKEINYAAGVIVSSFNGTEEIKHDGATAGYRSWLAYYPEKELSVVYLSNDGSVDPSSIGKAIAELFLGKEISPLVSKPVSSIDVTQKQLLQYAGMYKTILGEDVIELIFSNDSLRFKNVPGGLIPITSTKFYFEGFNISFPEKISNPERLLFQNPAGDTATYLKIEPFIPDENQLHEFAGIYNSDEADTKYTLIVNEGKLWVVRSGNERILLVPSYTDAFFDGGLSLFQFIRNIDKQIIGFTVSISRARGVMFAKEK